ncbi:MAG: OmpH family outer membrane protein [Candidatus Methylomirabilales bacterium]
MKRRFPHALTGLVMAGVFVGAGAVPVGAQTAKIGIVDLQRVLVGSKRGQEVLSKLQAEKSAKQRELATQEKEIRQMEADLEKQRDALSPDAQKDRERTIRDRTRDLRRIVEDLNASFGERERDLQQRLVQEVAVVVRAMGKEKGYFMIMEKRLSGVMYGSEAADLTDEVIAAYDASVSKK